MSRDVLTPEQAAILRRADLIAEQLTAKLRAEGVLTDDQSLVWADAAGGTVAG